MKLSNVLTLNKSYYTLKEFAAKKGIFSIFIQIVKILLDIYSD